MSNHHHNHENCNHNHENCNHNHDEHQTLTITTDDGEEIICDVIGIFDFEDREYIALLPQEGEEVFIYRYSEDNGETILDLIEDDLEYNDVGAHFLSIMEEDDV